MAKENSARPTSDVHSGLERGEIVSYAGGEPTKKDVEAIEKANSPDSRKRAPGSVRV